MDTRAWEGFPGRRVLIYSHDSFGLGHLRRCREIAHTLVATSKEISVLILSGSPIIGSFDFRARVDFIRIPGVIKLRDGGYTSLGLHIDIRQTLALRAAIIENTARLYHPDIFIADKEPLGLNGEIASTLALLKSLGTVCILGLRDILDEPSRLAQEWKRKKATQALEEFYDAIWIYGPRSFYDPLQGIPLSPAARARILYTGYLARHITRSHKNATPQDALNTTDPYLLITSGGGGDGERLVDWVLASYEQGLAPNLAPLFILGPFMPPEAQRRFRKRIRAISGAQALSFHPRLEHIFAQAQAVVCMGGYNTFCEILSFDRRALLVPRTTPRLEQSLRAERAAALGLCSYLHETLWPDPEVMGQALQRLLVQSPPSAAAPAHFLKGKECVAKAGRAWLGLKSPRTEPKVVPERSAGPSQ